MKIFGKRCHVATLGGLSFKKHAYLTVFAFMFCKQFLAYTAHIDRSAFLCNP